MSLDSTIAQAKDLFGGLGPLSHRKMFGGAGLYAEGVMFCLLADGEIYLKATGDFAAELEAEGAAPFVYDGKSKPIAMSYWTLPDAAHDDPTEADRLARRALACAHEAKA